ncbi:MAG: sugar ABC transporter permease [Candidatus Riflebacteria bacterium]|nr:sugar ABC transporter permease [Candidatus Riflebacteria bacterium]
MRRRRLRRPDDWGAYAYLLPALLVLALFHLLPIFYSLALSGFEDAAGNMFAEFVGLQHYWTMLGDRLFWTSMANTVWFVLGTVPLSMAAALAVALALNTGVRGLGFYRTVYFLPVVTSAAAVSLVWKWVYHPQRGLLNEMMSWLGLPGQNWLHEPTGLFALVAGHFHLTCPDCAAGPSLAMVSIIMMSVWQRLGYNVVIFLAGLQTIPQELYEAARIDGAGPVRTFWNVTWPLLSPTTYFVLVMSTISSFQVFNQVFMLYGSNVTENSRVIVYYLYEKGFHTFQMGYASALAYVLFLLIMVMTLVQKRFVGGKVHYA